MILCCSAALDEHRQQLNDLNVFPVPDGDTGTNMSMTMAAAAQALRENAPPAVGEAANKAASALLRGARGNSGVIMSLLFRGMAKSLKGKTDCTAAEYDANDAQALEAVAGGDVHVLVVGVDGLAFLVHGGEQDQLRVNVVDAGSGQALGELGAVQAVGAVHFGTDLSSPSLRAIQ